MNIVALIILALSMSTDAFAVSVAKGASTPDTGLRHSLKAGAIFGIVEGITPLIGWALGFVAAGVIMQWDHWIALIVLSILGLKMIRDGFKSSDKGKKSAQYKGDAWHKLLVTGMATSIDALAVGITLAFMNVNIWLAAGLIGLSTFIFVTVGTLLGSAIGIVVGQRAQIIGGAVLILVGCIIFYQHMMA